MKPGNLFSIYRELYSIFTAKYTAESTVPTANCFIFRASKHEPGTSSNCSNFNYENETNGRSR